MFSMTTQNVANTNQEAKQYNESNTEEKVPSPPMHPSFDSETTMTNVFHSQGSIGSWGSDFMRLMQSGDSRSQTSRAPHSRQSSIPTTAGCRSRSDSMLSEERLVKSSGQASSLAAAGIAMGDCDKPSPLNNPIREQEFKSPNPSRGKGAICLERVFLSQLPPAHPTETPNEDNINVSRDDDVDSASEYTGSISSIEEPAPKPRRRKPTKKRKRTRKVYEPEHVTPVDYTDLDVLCQRGGLANHHPGNIRYLQEKDKLQPTYLAASKKDKTVISQELVDRVHAWGGRFLRKETASQTWYEVHQHTARTKAGQTLRENLSSEDRAAKRVKYPKRR